MNIPHQFNLLSNIHQALILCAHTDDEQGCAGLIIRLLQQNANVIYIALSRCEESVPEAYPEDTLELECRESTLRLGINPNNVLIWRFPVRHFPAHRQEVLEEFVRLNHDHNPDLVLLPSSYDNHQDHVTVFQEGFRAFKHSSILGYELPQNLIAFSNTAFVKLSDEILNQKIHALESYKSQTFRNYTSAEFIRSLAKVRGTQCNAEYAEAYEVIRIII